MSIQNTIYIIGAGAIGKVLAVFLTNQGKNVVLIRGSIDEVQDHMEEMTVELKDHTEIKATILITSLSKFSDLQGIVVVANKSFGNKQLAIKLQKKISNSPLVVLQNGLNVEIPFLDAGIKNIFRCVLFTSSQFIGPDRLRFKPAKPSQIGRVKGTTSDVGSVAGALNTAYFEFNPVENIQPVIWTKAIANIVFNSICPLLETDNGIFYRNADALDMAKRIIIDCITVAKSSGLTLELEEVIKTVLMISKSSEGQLISTYQDIINKRETEIDSLNFALTSIATNLEMSNSVREVRLLGQLIKLKSELSSTSRNLKY